MLAATGSLTASTPWIEDVDAFRSDLDNRSVKARVSKLMRQMVAEGGHCGTPLDDEWDISLGTAAWEAIQLEHDRRTQSQSKSQKES